MTREDRTGHWRPVAEAELAGAAADENGVGFGALSQALHPLREACVTPHARFHHVHRR